MVKNPRLMDWFTILSQDRNMAETAKLKQQDKTLNKLAKSLQKRLNDAIQNEKTKSQHAE